MTAAGTLVLAGLSVRLMAEATRAAGLEVIALDAFGDRDTRRVARAWYGVGRPQGPVLDPPRVLEALRRVRQEHRHVIGWVAGSGFEAWPDLLRQAAAELRLIGTPVAAQQVVRTPSAFFAGLTLLGLPHPATQLHPPAHPAGWLQKDFAGSGGWQVRPASAPQARPGPGCHYQRRMPGRPMSALFVANGREACVLGHQQQLAGALHGLPFVWQGVIGPLLPPPAVQAGIQHALAALVPRHGLQGLGSLDYLLDGDAHWLLEINPRPSASMALYPGEGHASLMLAHLEACLNGRLPQQPPLAGPAPAGHRPLRGTRTVYASRPARLDDAALEALAATGWCHDLAQGPQAFRRGEPVCTVSGEVPPPKHLLMTELEQQLEWRARQVQARLAATETTP